MCEVSDLSLRLKHSTNSNFVNLSVRPLVMTRIRRNWTSSRGAQVPEASPVLSHVVDTNEVDTEGKAASPIRLHLVDEDAALAAASLKSLEHDVAGFHILKHESKSSPSKIWDRFVFGGLLRQGRSENCSRKMLDHFGPEPDCVSTGGVSSAMERVDEVQLKSSPVALDEDDSYKPVGVERVAVGVGGKDKQGDRQEMKVESDDSPVVQRLVSGSRTGRKKRHRRWDSDFDLTLAMADVHMKVSRDAAVDNKDMVKSAWNFRPKLEKVTNDQCNSDRKKSKIGMNSHKVSLSGRKIKPEQKTGDTEKSAADSFPLGWKYRGLAQIAEKDKAARAREDRCGRTDGRLWQCPLKRKQGSSLCEHHLNKFRLKKMYKTRGTATIEKSDAALISPDTSDSTFKPCKPLDYDTDARTKFRRRYKTAKLSIL